MEPIQAPLLTMVEAFGTRYQETMLGDTVVPTWDTRSDVLGNLRLVGQDVTSGVIPAGSSTNASVRVAEDTYITGLWITEPAGAADIFWLLDCFVQRNAVGTFFQLTPLSANDRQIFGTGSATLRRTFPLLGWPWGALARAGDIISATVLNNGATPSTAGFVLAYRGLQGPPP